MFHVISFSLIIMVQLSHHFTDMHKNLSVSFNNAKIGVLISYRAPVANKLEISAPHLL